MFEGWLKATVLFAIVPLMAVLIGGGAVVALDPVVRSISLEGAQPSTRGVAVLFLGAAVYLALMVMAVKTAATLVTGWRLPGNREQGTGATSAAAEAALASRPAERMLVAANAGTGIAGDDRVRSMVAALPAPTMDSPGLRRVPTIARTASAEVIHLDGSVRQPARRDQRALGLGSRFRSRPEGLSREHVA